MNNPCRFSALANRNAMTLPADAATKCYMAGVPRATYTPGPFQIFQSAVTVIVVYQDLHTYRYIPTARRQSGTHRAIHQVAGGATKCVSGIAA